ncbi:S8 family serine peptidase [Bacillus sp. V3B]|nr:S8 family serine peptidase [Bacillus sp. V3B]
MLLLFFLFTTQAVTARPSSNIPPLPALDQYSEQIAIFMINQELTEDEILHLLQKYPHIQLRKTFKYALNGFSAIGSQKSLEQLAKEEPISKLSVVNHYKVSATTYQQGDNIKIIGGEQVRGIFDKQNRRLTGKGIKIGVIDTGIDYRHEDLRKSYGGGYDVVDGDGDPMETNDVNGVNTLHGTHVAGVIAANGRMKGVAPEATILAYRALGPGGAGTTEQVIEAIDQAIDDKVDILNLSLGNNVNGPDLPLSVALNNAVDHGITAVTSSGNSGPNIWTVGTPGTASKAISVGASTPTMKIPYIEIGGERIRLEPLQGSVEWDLDRTYELKNGGIGKVEQLKNVQGKIALIERGELTFSEKVNNAKSAGAIAVIIYNNTSGPFRGNLDQTSTIPVMSMTKKEGEKLKKKIDKGVTQVKTLIIEEKDILADFSSRGPVTSTWEIKPDILAPGVAITSTVPRGYLSLQGTSMSSPHVAGACALIKQAHPEWGPEKIKAALMNYAKPLRNKEGKYYKTYEQGAGRIQLKESIEAEVLVYPASLQFGKFQFSDRIHEHEAIVTVENTTSKTKKLTFENPKQEPGINWDIPMSSLLRAGEKRDVTISMSADPKIFKKKIQDGMLTIRSDGKNIQVPYLFVLEEPDYPRVMGFDFGAGDEKGTFRYEVYLPGGADEFGIALFDVDTYQFIQFIDWKRNIDKGLIQQEISEDKLPTDGLYVAKVFARKAGQEDWIETYLQIETSRK